MIRLTRPNLQTVYLNPDLIETIEEFPDTLLTLNNGARYIVLERPDEIIARIVDFRTMLMRRSAAPLPHRIRGRRRL